MGILAIEAAKLRDEGLEAKEIAERIRAMTPLVRTSFVLDTLEFMHKGGRCTGVQKLGANLFNLKPCIEVKDGSMIVGRKYRGSGKTVLPQYVEVKLKDKTDLQYDKILITHTGVEDGILQSVIDKIKEVQPSFKEIIPTRAGCSVSVHCGPNTLGLIYLVDGSAAADQ